MLCFQTCFVYRILITLLYSKSLFLNREYLRCFELLQQEFINFPQFLSLIYAYGKYVILAHSQVLTPNPEFFNNVTNPNIKASILSGMHDQQSNMQKNYIGSAIGALEECLRSQVKERHARISYFLGRAYQEQKRPLKVSEYWENIGKAGSGLSL